MIRLQPDIIVARLSKNIAGSSSQSVIELGSVTSTSSDTQMTQASKSNPRDLVALHYSCWASSPSWLRLLFGSLEYQRRKGQRRGRKYEQVQAQYELPGLFSTTVLDVIRHRSLSD